MQHRACRNGLSKMRILHFKGSNSSLRRCILCSFGFLQIVTKPTRITENSATLIDHILTNSSNNVFESLLLLWKISDHLPLIHNISFKKSKIKPPIVKSRNFSQANVNRFKKALHNYNWDHVISENCPQLAFTNFTNTFNNLIDVFFPESSKKFNSNLQKIEPWMSAGILVSRRNKGLLYKSQLKNPTPTLFYATPCVHI